jgi:hypothetical protein
MLPFYYMFHILVLSSSVISFRQNDGESKLLLNNADERLNKLWGRIETSKPETAPTWPDAEYLDGVIKFEIGTLGVEKVNLFQVKRSWMPFKQREKGVKRQDIDLIIDTNRVVRSHYKKNKARPVKMHTLRSMHIDENCRQYLDDTYWGRNPDFLGLVSDSLRIWKH